MHKALLREHPCRHQLGWSLPRASSSSHLSSGLPWQFHRSIHRTNFVSVVGREPLLLGWQPWLAKRNRLVEHLRNHGSRAGTSHQISFVRAGSSTGLCGPLFPSRNEPPFRVHLSSYSLFSLASPRTKLRRLCIWSSHALHAPARVRPNPSVNRTRYGRQRKAGARRLRHCRAPALHRPPSRAGYLER